MFVALSPPFTPHLCPSCSPGSAPWNIRVLLRHAGRHQLRGYAGGGVCAVDASAGVGARRLLPPGSAPPAWHVLHTLQPRRLQEPAHLTPAGA